MKKSAMSSVAHELLTPLTYMKGYAKVAKRDSLTKEEREEYLQIIEDETDSVTDLVQDLFMLVQLEQHQFVIKQKCFFSHFRTNGRKTKQH